jgi:UDP-N-acetylmuramyl tripeptide synthase
MVSTAMSQIPASGPDAPRLARSRPPVRNRRGIRPATAVGLARITTRLVGAAHHRGTALPGLAAERIWPSALTSLASQLAATILVIGTNGKTTTAGLIAEILGGATRPPIANRSGANMRQGIVTSLVLSSDLRGRIRPGRTGPPDAVFEVDEAALEQVLPELGPTVIVATNLFRDQLDRYGEADAVVDRWAVALSAAAEGTILIHCADDPRLAMLASETKLAYRTFGLAGIPTDRDQPRDDEDAIADPVACRSCGRQLLYTWHSIGHLGDFHCPLGHIRRTDPDVAFETSPAVVTPGKTGSVGSTATIRLTGPLGRSIATPKLMGLTNAYNVAAAVTAGTVIGRSMEQGAKAIDGYKGPFGRLEQIEIAGRFVVLTLIKNTVSLGETVRLVSGVAADVVLLGLSDSPADGQDISWIWDAPIAPLVAGRAVVLTGSRAADLRLRLKYDSDNASRPPRSIEQASSPARALELALSRAPLGGIVLAAATYTAMLSLRAIDEQRGDAPAIPR